MLTVISSYVFVVGLRMVLLFVFGDIRHVSSTGIIGNYQMIYLSINLKTEHRKDLIKYVNVDNATARGVVYVSNKIKLNILL